MKWILSIFVVLAFLAQATGFREARLVCKYTGRVMAGCKHELQRVSPGLASIQDCCCELHQGAAPAVSVSTVDDVFRKLARERVAADLPPASTWPTQGRLPVVALAAGPPRAPPRSPLFIVHRQLLI